MKTTKKLLVALAAIAIALPACKRGAEDGMSLKSRNSRVTGTWELTSYSYTSSSTNSSAITNDVNIDAANSSSTSNSSWAVSGGSYTSTNNTTYSSDDLVKNYDPFDQRYESATTSSEGHSNFTETGSYTMSIKIYKDNTYEATTHSSTGTITTDSKDSYTDNSGVTTSVANDTTYSAVNVSDDVEVGSWFWEEGSNKSKLVLHAGPLNGYVAKLTSKEMILEPQFGQAISSDPDNNAGDAIKGDGNRDDISDVYYDQYDNDDPYDYKNGKETDKVVWTSSEASSQILLTKTDKASKRE